MIGRMIIGILAGPASMAVRKWTNLTRWFHGRILVCLTGIFSRNMDGSNNPISHRAPWGLVLLSGIQSRCCLGASVFHWPNGFSDIHDRLASPLVCVAVHLDIS